MTEKPEWVVKLEAEECSCEICPSCDGRGYLQSHARWSDLEMDDPGEWTCNYCNAGVSETCDRCILLEEYEREND